MTPVFYVQLYIKIVQLSSIDGILKTKPENLLFCREIPTSKGCGSSFRQTHTMAQVNVTIFSRNKRSFTKREEAGRVGGGWEEGGGG